MRLPKLRFSAGFTLIELMVVMTVISILVGMVLYGLNRSQQAARDASRQQIMNGVQGALERYYGDNQKYPDGTFCDMVGSLVTAQYLSSGPKDPGQGGGTAVCSCAPTPGTCSGATYDYTVASDEQSYGLTLTKESGGTSEFHSPE